MSDDDKILADAAKLPIDERAAHSNWKARSAAYEHIKAACSTIHDNSDPSLSEFVAVLPKAMTDGNAAALDKALEALQAVLGLVSDGAAGRMANTACSNIVSKALGARPSTAAKGVDCLMAFVEAEQSDKAAAALVEGFGNKVPKVVVGALDATLQLIRAFGGRVMPGQTILKAMPAMLESKDAKAREKVKEIVAELARWMGPDLIRAALFEKMRDAMKEDVEKLLQEAPQSRPQPERLTRKDAAKAAAAGPSAEDAEGSAAGEEAADGGGAVAAAAQEPAQPDSYESAEPRDIIPDLKKEFWDGLASAKWSERKAALTELKVLASYPRLMNGDYGDLNRELKKLITKDSNIQVVSEAINCTANISKGLRKEYRGPATSLCPVLLEKFKDKASVVNKAAAEALGVMATYSFGLGDVAEDVTVALAHQNPKVKEGTLAWLTDCVPRESKAGMSKLLGALVPAVAKCTDEGAPSIREAALNCLMEMALKAGGMSGVAKGLGKMDEPKRKKLDEMVAEAARTRRPGGAAAAAPAAAKGPSRGVSRPASGGPSPVTSPRGSCSGSSQARSAAARSSSSKSRPGGAAGARPKPAAGAGGGRAAAAAAGGGGDDDAEEDEALLSRGLMTAFEAKARLAELLGEELVSALGDPQWKVRLEAMEVVAARAQDCTGPADCAVALTHAVSHLPGWDEKNFQVMARQFEVIRCCAAQPSFGKREALVAVMGGVDKLADLKLKEPVFQMLLAASEAVGPHVVASLLHNRAAIHKNPKVLTEAINWINLALTDFLLPAFNVKSLLDWAKEDLGSATAATRTAATLLLGTMHGFLGPALAELVRSDVKPALMNTLEVEFSKHPQQSGWEAKRVSRAAPKAGGGGGKPPRGQAGAAAAAAEEPASMDDLLPRTDISGKVSSELVAKLGSANWKERKEALDEVEGLITAAGGRIQPCVGDLMPALKGRLADSNKNLISQTLQLLGKLARAMGRAIVREARPVLGPSVRCICDSKHYVRSAVIEMLDAWVHVAPPDLPFDELVEVLPSPKCVSEGMQAAITWMASVYAAGKGTSPDCVALAVKAVAIGASYKTVPVREAAGQLLEAALGTVGLGEVQQAVQGLSDKALQKAAIEALTKCAGAGAMAAAAATSRPGTAGSGGNSAGSAAVRSSAAAGSRPGTAGSVRASAAGRPGAAAAAGGGAGVGRSVAANGTGGLLSRAGAAGTGAAAGAAGGALAGDEGALLALDRGKEERARKARFKSNKFEIRPDDVAQLEADLGALSAPGLRVNLFAKDFKRQVLAADALRAWISNDEEEALDACVACLDLLLRWSVVRLAEGNTQTLVGVTGMLKVLLERLNDRGYRLSEAEAKVFLPGLVEKCGQPQPNVKAECRDLLRRVSGMYPPTKVLFFMQEGLNSKNNRSRVTCAEEIGCLVEREGPRVYAGAKCDVLAALARLVAEPGKEIRAAALGALEVVYAFEGEGIWKQLGALNGQQKGILEDRLRTVDKDLARRGLAAGYKKAEFEAARASLATGALPAGGAGGPFGAGGEGGGEYAAQAAAVASVGSGGSARGSRDEYAPAAAALAAAGGSAGGGSMSLRASKFSSSGSLLGREGGSSAGGGQQQQQQQGVYGSSGGGSYSSYAITNSHTAAGELSSNNHSSSSGSGYFQQQQQQGASSGGSAAADAAAAAVLAGGGLQPLQSFSSEPDMEAEFKKCMTILRDGATDDVVEVMKLLCYEMLDLQRSQAATAAGGSKMSGAAEAVWMLLQQSADPLVAVLTYHTQQIFSSASAAMRCGSLPPASARACKYALNTLMNFFNTGALPARLSGPVLTGLVRVLLLRLVDDNLGRLEEGENLLKALNVLMLKILENCNRNYTFSALLTLLLDVPRELSAAGAPADAAAAQQQQQLSLRWADLVVKCLIKSTKALPQVIQTIDLHSLLLSLHGFFEALGVAEIRRRSHADDKPLRMVKTILHELCKLKGTDIYRYTADIPQHGSTSGADGRPVIFPYIELNIQTLQSNGTIRASGAPGAAGPGGGITPGRGLTAAAGAAAGGAAGSRTPGAGLRAHQAAGGVDLSDLSACFKRLSTHKDIEEKRAALVDMHRIICCISQEQGLPLDKVAVMYLPDATQAFRSYIIGEMRRINQEQQQQQQAAVGSAAAAAGDGGHGSSSSGGLGGSSQPDCAANVVAAARLEAAGDDVSAAAGRQEGGGGGDCARGLGASYLTAHKAGLGTAPQTPGVGSAVAAGSAAAAAGSRSFGVVSAPAAGGGGGGGAPTMEELKARMSQLQSERSRMLNSGGKHLAAAAAAAGGNGAAGTPGGALSSAAGGAGLLSGEQQGLSGKGVAVAAVGAGGAAAAGECDSIGAARGDVAQQQQQSGAGAVAAGGSINLHELKSRMRAWQGSCDG